MAGIKQYKQEGLILIVIPSKTNERWARNSLNQIQKEK